jgi:hypothetical protein
MPLGLKERKGLGAVPAENLDWVQSFPADTAENCPADSLPLEEASLSSEDSSAW